MQTQRATGHDRINMAGDILRRKEMNADDGQMHLQRYPHNETHEVGMLRVKRPSGHQAALEAEYWERSNTEYFRCSIVQPPDRPFTVYGPGSFPFETHVDRTIVVTAPVLHGRLIGFKELNRLYVDHVDLTKGLGTALAISLNVHPNLTGIPDAVPSSFLQPLRL